MEEVRNGQQTQDCIQWGLTALPPLGCDSRILTRAQGGKAKRPLVRELVVGAFRELPEMQYACIRVGWPCLCNGAA